MSKMVLVKAVIHHKIVTKLIDRAVLDGLGDGQIRLRLLACGWSVDLSRIERRRRLMQERGVPV